MPNVECKLGPTEQTVGGQTYSFEYDRDRRAVAMVNNPHHLTCFLNTGNYRVADADALYAPPDPAPLPPAPVDPQLREILGRGQAAAQSAAGTITPPPAAGVGAAADVSDDLTMIKGIGPASAEKLKDFGIATFEQLATLTDDEIAKIDSALDLRGKIISGNWVGQAAAICTAASTITPPPAAGVGA